MTSKYPIVLTIIFATFALSGCEGFGYGDSLGPPLIVEIGGDDKPGGGDGPT